MRMKLGEVTSRSRRDPAPNALARWVLPAPRSPHRQTRSPACADGRAESSRPKRACGGRIAGPIDRGARIRRSTRRIAAQMNRSRSPSGTAVGRPVGEMDDARLELHAAREPARPDRPAQRPSRPASGPPRTRTKSGRRSRHVRPRALEHEHRRIADDRDLVPGQRLEDRLHRAGKRPPGRALEDEHGERRQSVEGGALARLRGQEVAPLLAGQAGRPRSRARPSPGRASASPRRPASRRRGSCPPRPTSRPPERSSPSLPAAICRRPRLGPPSATTPRIARPSARIVMPDPGPDLADDAGDRRFDRIGDVAGRNPPATAASRTGTRPRISSRRAGSRPSSARRARSAGSGSSSSRRGRAGARRSALRDDRLAGRDERPVARREGERDLSGRVDEPAGADRGPGRRARPLPTRRSASRVDPGHERGLPRVEQLASQVGAIRAAAAGRRAGRRAARRARRPRRPRSAGRARRAGRCRGSGTRPPRSRPAAGR